jgi:glycosyltransferase involved in cell wall biosynthesis
MQILFLSSGLSDRYGGAPVSESSLANELFKDHKVIVLCPKDRHDPRFSRQNIHCPTFDFTRTEVLSAMGNGEHWLSRLFETSDVLHINGHWRWENYLFARLAERSGIPYLLHPRGMLVLNQQRPLLKRLFNLLLGNQIVRGASHVVALSQYETRQFEPYSIAEEKILILPNGIPDIDIASIPRLKGAGGKRFLLYLGRIDPRKNLLFLVNAFSQVAPKISDLDLYFVGPAEKGYDTELEERVSQLGLESRVRFLPGVYGAEKWSLLKGASAVVYPAVDEAFGRVIFETIKAGSFPLFPVESGGAEYLSRSLPFCSYRQNSKESFLEALMLTLEQAEEKRASLASAEKWVREELNWEKIARRMVQTYSQAIREVSRRPLSLADGVYGHL